MTDPLHPSEFVVAPGTDNHGRRAVIIRGPQGARWVLTPYAAVHLAARLDVAADPNRYTPGSEPA